jgi:hypothetical protein
MLAELHRLENVVLQQMEQDDMANENPRDQGVASEPDQPKESRSPAEMPPQSGPPALDGGLESPRSSNC